MRLLLAEDDAHLGKATCAYMMRLGHAVDWVTNGNQLLQLAAAHPYDCVLLDLGLPELSGRDCLVNLRQRGNGMPVIVTTASGYRDQRIGLLDLGADDYLVKPYDLAELAARVAAIVRRSQLQAPSCDAPQVYGPLTIDPATSSVAWHGRQIALTVKELVILEALLKRPNWPVSRQQLEAEVYGWNEAVESNAIEVHVHFLRRKIDPALIETVRGAGYRIGSLEKLARPAPGPGVDQGQQPSGAWLSPPMG